MLEIIYGEAGTGKSTLLYKKISETAESGKKVFLFVPDQFSFEAEKIIYKCVKAPFGMNVTVTMFSRAAQDILKLYGETKPYADDIVKTILMNRVLKSLDSRGSLVYYKKQLKNKGFPGIMLGIISEIKGGGLSPSELRKAVTDNADNFSELLMNKLNDICEIYTEYDALLKYDSILKRSYDDRLDDVSRAARLCNESEYFKDSVCFFDCFDEFSGSQMEFIRAVCSSAEKAVFTVTTDKLDKDKTIFMATSQLAGKLKEIDNDAVLTCMKERYRSTPECEIVRAQDMWQESDWICSCIHSLTDKGYRYRDIAVLTPDKSYGQIISSAMKKYEIPAFMDIPEPLIDKSVVRFIIYSLQALSFETDDLLRYVKSGFVRLKNGKTISRIHIDRLEQLCRQYNIKSRDWLRTFPKKADPDGSMEELRLEIIAPLQEFKNKIDNADGMEMTEALCDFLCNKMEVGKRIYSIYIEGKTDDGKLLIDKKKQDEYSSLWDDVVEVLESAHEALKGSAVNLEEFTDILIQAFSSAEIAKPPQVLDSVTVGDVARSRFTDKKAVFICGMNQGVFPRSAKSGVNFTGSETEQLIMCGITIGKNRVTRASSELFKLYRCVNIPSEKLFITYSMLNDSFSQIEPSPYVDDIGRHFGIRTMGADEYGADFYCRTEKATKHYLAKIYYDYTRIEEKNAITEFMGNDPFESSSKPVGERHSLSEKFAEQLLNKDSFSPTAFNMANNCRYSYYCRYGLGIKEPDKRELSPVTAGNVMHYCMEKLLTEKGDKFTQLTDKEISDHVEKSLEEYLKNELISDFGEGERFTYQVKKFSDLAVPVAQSVKKSISEDGFVPKELERQVEYKLGDVTISGKCDRIDVSADDKYVRVVDYKRGKNELPMKNVYNGEDLQMLLYLYGISEEYQKKPSSVLYQYTGEPVVKKAESSDLRNDLAASEESNTALRIANGLIIKDSPDNTYADSLNNTLNERFKTKRKKAYAKSPIITQKNFDSLKEYCKAYVNSVVLQVKKGMISACPKDESKCDYCIYSLFCGHEKEVED